MRTMFLALAAFLIASPAYADRPVTPGEHAAISQALAVHGCRGGKFEFDRDDNRYEVDDTRCADGREYDIDLDTRFRIIKKKRD